MKDEELKLMAAQGLPVNMIAQELGVGVSTIYRRLSELGIEPPGPDRLPLTPEQRKELAQKRIAGATVGSLCREYSISNTAVQRVLMSEGVDSLALRLEEKDANDERMELAIKMYQEGYPLWKIKEQTGYAASSVINQVHRRGLPMRSDRYQQMRELREQMKGKEPQNGTQA